MSSREVVRFAKAHWMLNLSTMVLDPNLDKLSNISSGLALKL